MESSTPLRQQLNHELRQIPVAKLAEALDLVQHFRLGLQTEKRDRLPGAPARLTEEAQLLDELRACIHRPNPAALGEFRLDLKGYRFEREDANAR